MLLINIDIYYIYTRSSFNSTENSNLNDDSLDIGLQSGPPMDDSLSGFNLLQAVAAVGQSSVTATSDTNKCQGDKAPLILGATGPEVGFMC